MLGFFIHRFRAFVVAHGGEAAWNQTLADAKSVRDAIPPDQYLPEGESLAILAAGLRACGAPEEDAAPWLESFGRSLAPELVDLGMTWGLCNPRWGAMDYVDHVQHVIHSGFVKLCPSARPPTILSLRYTPAKALVIYRSSRKLCPLVPGIIHGIADGLQERLLIEERRCMLQGDPECWFFVRAAPG
ncbi:MAG: heme NO-binding domain-containing protein [Magnetococcales bacterium]|nr:heme NO-binding domain-containing protein [Magnetococcales bacterium]